MKLFRSLTLAVLVGTLAVDPALALNCAAPKLESEALLCRADQIHKRRVKTVVAGALAGALIGNLFTHGGGGDKTRSTMVGALAGGLAGYWLSVSNEIKAKNASDKARAAEVQARAAAEAKMQRTSASNLNQELKVALLRSPTTADDQKQRDAQLGQIAQAASLGSQQANDSSTGYSKVAQEVGTSYNGQSDFGPTANSFDQTRSQACAAMTKPGKYCNG